MSKNKKLRLVLDTNLWISFIISKHLNAIDSLFYSKNARLLFSAELIKEMEATISKPKLRKYFPESSFEEMLMIIDPFVDFITVKSKVKICRDPKDDFLLALAKDGKADYLITGDKDLLTIGKFEYTRIISITEFKEKY